MTLAGNLVVRFSGDLTALDATLKRGERLLDQHSRRMTSIGRKLALGISLPLIAAGGAALKMSSDFDSSMTQIVTLVGIAEDQVKDWRKELLAMAAAVGRGPGELAKALFVVTSAGERGANALTIVEQAAKASASGLGDTAAIARVVTAAMQAYGSANLSATRATEILVATVREGNLEAASLAGSLGGVIGVAAQLGVSFDQVGAFIATFTRVGVSADEAVTALRGTLTTILKPTSQAQEALKAYGLSAADLRKQLRDRGLTDTLLGLVNTLRGNDEALAAVIGNVRALAGVLGVATTQAESFRAIQHNITNSTGILDEAFARVQKTTAFTFSSIKAHAEATAIAFGDQLAPSFQKVMVALQPLFQMFVRLIRVFAEMPPAFQSIVIGSLAFLAALGPLFIVGGQVVGMMSGMIGMAKMLGIGLAGLGTTLAVGAPIIVGLGLLVAFLVKTKIEAAEAAAAVEASIRKMRGGFAGMAEDDLKRAVTVHRSAVTEYTRQLDALKKAAADESAEKVVTQVGFDEIRKVPITVTAQRGRATDATQQQIDETEKLIRIRQAAADAANEQLTAQQQLRKQMEELVGTTGAVASSEDELQKLIKRKLTLIDIAIGQEKAAHSDRIAFIDAELAKTAEGTDRWIMLMQERISTEKDVTEATKREADRQRTIGEKYMEALRARLDFAVQAGRMTVQERLAQINAEMQNEKLSAEQRMDLDRQRFALLQQYLSERTSAIQRAAGDDIRVARQMLEELHAELLRLAAEFPVLAEHVGRLLKDMSARSAGSVDHLSDRLQSLSIGWAESFAAAAVSGKLSMKSFVNSALADLARLAARMLMVRALGLIFAPATGGVSLLGGGLSGFAAAGANVRAGESWIVGERGPEIFQPHVGGQVRPIQISNVGAAGRPLVLDFSNMPPAMDPFTAVRDAGWQAFLRNSFRVAQSQGFNVEVRG